MSSDVAKTRAFSMYLAMPERTLRGLEEELAKVGLDEGFAPPCLRSLQRWSVEGRWQDRVRRHDAEVRERLQERVTAETVEEVAAGAKRLRGAASKLLDRVEAQLENLEISNVSDVQTAVATVLAAVREARIEEGGVSDRTGVVGQSPAEVQAYGEDLKARFRHLGPRPASPTPTPATTTRPVETAPEPEAEHTPTELYPEGDDEPMTSTLKH